MNFLWINTNPPVQMYTELKRAYDTTADRIWLANVGDIKPAENALSLFLDMAWDIDAFTVENVGFYYANTLSKYFGAQHRDALQHIFDEYFSLAFARKPEHMQHHLEQHFAEDNYHEAERRTARYAAISASRRDLCAVGRSLQTGFLPTGILSGQRRRAAQHRHPRSPAQPLVRGTGTCLGQQVRERVNAAIDELRKITKDYNELKDGKWRYMMTLAQGGWGDIYVPPTKKVEPAAAPGLGIHAESETLHTGMSNLHTLPAFNPFTDKSYYVDVFNTGLGELKWNAQPSETWIKLDKTAGSTPYEQRVNVSVDWDKAPKGAASAPGSSSKAPERRKQYTSRHSIPPRSSATA